MIFDYSKEDSVGTRDSYDYLSNWMLYVFISSQDPEVVFAVSERLQEYLESYSDSNFLAFEFLNEAP